MFGRIQKIYSNIRRIGWLYDELRRVSERIEGVNDRVDLLTSRSDLTVSMLLQFTEDRNSDEYGAIYSKHEPLVTVCIGTYNRADILLKRSLRSVLNQTYKNLQIIVIGDCCTDDTERAIRTLDDKRIFFMNLPTRGEYPNEPLLRWYVAGTSPVNYALSLAKGDFITHLDDDDEFTENRIDTLVQFIQESKADLVWHPFWHETGEGEWALNNAEEFRLGQVTTSAVFYHRWFAQVPWDINAFTYYEPGDWNRFRKIKYLGARTVRCGTPLLKHYKERNREGDH